MDREPIQSGPEEGGRMRLSKKIEPPPPADAETEQLEARARVKMQMGERLTDAEREVLAHLPDHDVRYQK